MVAIAWAVKDRGADKEASVARQAPPRVSEIVNPTVVAHNPLCRFRASYGGPGQISRAVAVTTNALICRGYFALTPIGSYLFVRGGSDRRYVGGGRRAVAGTMPADPFKGTAAACPGHPDLPRRGRSGVRSRPAPCAALIGSITRRTTAASIGRLRVQRQRAGVCKALALRSAEEARLRAAVRRLVRSRAPKAQLTWTRRQLLSALPLSESWTTWVPQVLEPLRMARSLPLLTLRIL